MAKEKKIKQSSPRGKKHTVISAASSDGKWPIWRFTNLDKDGEFAFDVNRTDFDSKDFLEKMINYSNMTWQEIKRQTHDEGKSKHHEISFDSLSREAQDRFSAKHLEQDEDAIFSFAFNNKVRIIGIRKDEYFHVLWYDPEHKVCPSTLQRT